MLRSGQSRGKMQRMPIKAKKAAKSIKAPAKKKVVVKKKVAASKAAKKPASKAGAKKGAKGKAAMSMRNARSGMGCPGCVCC
jgi:hypothetical protein